MLAPGFTTTTSWPIAGDVPDLNVIVDDQAATIAAQEALLHAYQGVLSAAQAPPHATATGTATGTTSLTLTAVTGQVVMGAVITGAGVPTIPAATITGGPQGGGNGTYTTNVALTLTNAALIFTPGGGPGSWPVPQDAATLNLVVQAQTAVIRGQTALLQQYQDLLTISQTAAPGSGP